MRRYRYPRCGNNTAVTYFGLRPKRYRNPDFVRKSYTAVTYFGLHPKRYIACSAIIIALFSSGCSARNKQAAAINQVGNTVASSYERDGLYSKPEKILTDADADHLLPEQKLHTNVERSKRIASMVRAMDSINSASVVVTGTVALVGIRIDEELSDDMLALLKDEVRNVVLQTDSGLQNVSVTAAPELSEKINRLAGDNTDGVPETMLNEDLQSILRRVSPTI